MQRASGQYDHLARVPRTGPRQSRGRRSFASRHWCRATPQRSRGMEPTVRNPRIESAIGSTQLYGVEQGLPIVAVARVVSDMLGVISPSEAPIKTPQELVKGK